METPEETKKIAQRLKAEGFKAVKFGWGPFGKSEENDIALVQAAREGLGDKLQLMVDADITQPSVQNNYKICVRISEF